MPNTRRPVLAAVGSYTAALGRGWRWLTLVHADDPLRAALNRGFAYIITVVALIGVLLSLAFVISNEPTSTKIVGFATLPILTIAWWLNRRGTIYGALFYVFWLVAATTLGSPPATLAGPTTPIPLILMLSVLTATLFIRPQAGLWALALQMGALWIWLAMSDVPRENIRRFMLIGTLNLGAITAFLMVGATIFSRALRASITANTALQQLNAELEQRVAERTADLESANRALLQANQSAERARVGAEEASRFKTEFLANMSHELRTPLNAILNFTQFLGDSEYGTLNEQQQMFQSRVVYNGEHLLGLINDILDLSKIEAGRMDLDREPADLAPILHGVMSTLVGLTKDKGLTIALDAEEPLPSVWIDRTRIRQVLLNLLSNAAKFTNQGGVTLHAHAGPHGFVQIAVHDTGIGIAPEHHALVFEEFRQVQGDLARSYQGTGLGLPISKRLIELHGGRMWLESAPGAGTTFFFTIPVAQQVRPAATAASAVGGPAIAVVDDDPDAQRIFRHILESAGYAVHSVIDGQAALSEIRRIRPALVILDLKMAPLDGWAVLGQIQSDPDLAELPVVICSIMDMDRQQVGVLTNVTAYLHKPVRRDDLLASIRRLAPSATILIADDDADARQGLRLLIEKRGCQVLEAADGATALTLLAQTLPDLVLLDLMMPGIDGFEVMERMQASPALASIPVVIVTAKDLDAQEQAWLRERTRHCFKKPIPGPIFVSVLDNLLKGTSRGSPTP